MAGCKGDVQVGGEMRSKVGTAKSAQHARQAQSGCSPALEEHPGEQVDRFLSQGFHSAVMQAVVPTTPRQGRQLGSAHVTPAAGLGQGGGRWFSRL